MKIGMEVEGRLQGLKTLFVSADEYIGLVFGWLKVDRQKWEFEQIYVSDHLNEIDMSLMVDEMNKVFGRPLVITVECTKIDKTPPDGVNVMLVIDSESFWHLREHDQIKFTKDMTVYATTPSQMVVTHPEAFDGDITL